MDLSSWVFLIQLFVIPPLLLFLTNVWSLNKFWVSLISIATLILGFFLVKNGEWGQVSSLLIVFATILGWYFLKTSKLVIDETYLNRVSVLPNLNQRVPITEITSIAIPDPKNKAEDYLIKLKNGKEVVFRSNFINWDNNKKVLDMFLQAHPNLIDTDQINTSTNFWTKEFKYDLKGGLIILIALYSILFVILGSVLAFLFFNTTTGGLN